ncbi:MAG: hypothetical protein DWQ07_19960 [Chloroflexi bacterium]|nr:MAG: hypothetical protein DWQ07_19960 [Chloroflexota bacterium]MBL1194359.1 hypothetical protein [Chloroflexota bacterium]NOH11647.1 hypothetical protein [Chloroflexota bacterium]
MSAGISKKSNNTLVEFDNGLLVEVESDDRYLSNVGKYAQRASRLDVRPIIFGIQESVLMAINNNLGVRPDKIEIEFGVGVDIEGMTYISKSTEESTIKIKLTVNANN